MGTVEKLIEILHGDGMLSLRAYWASVVGPQRLAMAARKIVKLKASDTAQIYGGPGSANAYVLVGVALPFNAQVNPLPVVFAREDKTGFNTGLPVRLTDNQVNYGFTQLLCPGEELFCQIMDGNITEQNVVVAMAVF